MFFVERVTGVAIYALTVGVFYVLFVTPRINNHKLYALLILVLSCMASLYVPYKTSDLYRIYDTLETISHMKFSVLYDEIIITKSNPMIYIYYWIVAKTGFFRLLPALNCCICYSFIFYIVRDMEERYDMSPETVANAILFTMLIGNYIPVIAGIKMMLALSMVIFVIYRELAQHKFSILNVVIYVFALFTHNIIIVILAIRFLVFLLSPRIKSSIKAIFIPLVVVGFVVIVILFPNVFRSMMDSGTDYLSGKSQYSDVWEYAVGILMCLYQMVLIVHTRKLINADSEHFQAYAQYNLLLMISIAVEILMIWNFTIFHRISVEFGGTVMLPLMMICMEYDYRIPRLTTKRILSFRSVTLLFSLALFLITGTRGSLSALKFFVL